jgi:hypothetical protein
MRDGRESRFPYLCAVRKDKETHPKPGSKHVYPAACLSKTDKLRTLETNTRTKVE